MALELTHAELAEALEDANICVLELVLCQLTGDQRWLRAPYAPDRSRGLDGNPTGGLSPELQCEVRAAAGEAIGAWLDGTPPAIARPSAQQLVEMLAISMGEAVPSEYGALLEFELGLADRSEELPDVGGLGQVLVVGAGLSGLAMARRLSELGIDFTVCEKNPGPGGTWYENRYPGAAVDTPSNLYSFSFAPYDWSYVFAPAAELFDYTDRLAEPVRDRIEFDTEVRSLRWDQGRWIAESVHDGEPRTRSFDMVVTAVGGLNRPKLPAIAGLEDFGGPVIHTARWPDDLDLEGKRVGVIGNGATAMQLVPAIAGEVARLDIFQRSPQWAAPFDQYAQPIPDALRKLIAAVPLYRIWSRLRSGWTFNDRAYDALQKDPEWADPARSVSAINDGHRRYFTRYIESELADRPDLIAACTPTYPPFGKRILLDTGWYKTLLRDDVSLICNSIERVEPGAVVLSNGERRELDVFICATGFDATRFLASMEIRGRSGQTLRDAWDDDDARAYMSVAVPDYPNLFMIYGPNSQAGHGGSLIGSAEVQIRHVLDALAQMKAAGADAIEVSSEAYARYSADVNARHERMIWTHPGMNTYYRNSRGRVVVPTPYRVVDYFNMARTADMSDYRLSNERSEVMP